MQGAVIINRYLVHVGGSVTDGRIMSIPPG